MTTHSRLRPHGRVPENLFADPFFQQNGWTRVPQLVQWMVTLDCPLSCPHCLASDPSSRKDSLPLENAEELVEEIVELGVPEFLLTGGEPLAHPDFAAIVQLLRRHQVRWSLNTSWMPDAKAREAIEQWPPVFVAVSLDGPPKVHDAFRGHTGAFQKSLEAISFFSTLIPGAVAAGTTVTSRNFRHLFETFRILVESHASEWGIHLLLPEGKAQQRRDLFLSRRQLRSLLRFVASKRQYFPITLADEIGYCGEMEPLLRDGPFYCGAGRAQCVILPDGEVVPCTTLDRSTSAGNIRTQSLRDIWENSFGDLRSWEPTGRCRTCEYARACEGGCWLQRRHGTQCFKDVWQLPHTAKSAAGLALCFGLLGAAQSASAERSAVPASPAAASAAVRPAQDLRIETFDQMQPLQKHIIQWYAAWTDRVRVSGIEEIREDVERNLAGDPGAEYFLDFMDGNRPRDLEQRAAAIRSAFETEQRSLCLAGLLWRDIAEWCFESAGPAERTDRQSMVLRNALRLLEEKATSWREEVYQKKLDPFLRRRSDYRRFFMSKAGPPPEVLLGGKLAKERWGPSETKLTEDFLEEHPYAESMRLEFAAESGSGLTVFSGTDSREIGNQGRIGVFEIIKVPDGAPAVITFQCGIRDLRTSLPPGKEILYADVLRLVYEQNRGFLDGTVQRQYCPRPLVLPALYSLEKELAASGDPKQRLWQLRWSLADMWLF